MRKIDLTGYDVTVRNGETQEQKPYRVVDSLCTVLLHPVRQLNGTIQADGIQIDISPTVKTCAVVARTIAIACTGGTYYMMLSDVR